MGKLNLLGERFGRLVVIAELPSRKGRTYWLCRCDCGTEKAVQGAHLRTRVIRSCKCLLREKAAQSHTIHGHARRGKTSTEYDIWCGMNQRCFDPATEKWKNYGGRGITVCSAWANSFESFFKDMGPRPSGYTLERIDVNGNYEPDNCTWIPAQKQAANRRNVINVVYDGKTYYLTELARYLGVSPKRLHYYYRSQKLSLDEAIRRLKE